MVPRARLTSRRRATMVFATRLILDTNLVQCQRSDSWSVGIAGVVSIWLPAPGGSSTQGRPALSASLRISSLSGIGSHSKAARRRASSYERAPDSDD
ncbi:MAG: hypothetical protein F6K11_25910 [Leptolyngbya sp. SIO3F4]|nr:hypothetical protein [Leptolyngbya sp. SIO3F4]